jgi:hypothetical protein
MSKRDSNRPQLNPLIDELIRERSGETPTGLLRDSGNRRLNGLTVLSCWAINCTEGSVCDLLGDQAALHIVSQVGGSKTSIPYAEVRALEIGGPGLVQRGGGVVGGGFGLVGVAEGLLIAKLMNSLTTRTVIVTIVRVVADRAEAAMLCTTNPPDQLRTALAPILRRIEDAHRLPPAPPSLDAPQHDIGAAIRQLAALRDEGLVSAEQFEAKRDELLKRL